MASNLIYFVEGECEKAFLKSFIFSADKHFRLGRVEVFNFINERLSKQKARSINERMSVAIVFDTDVDKTDLLDENIKVLKTVSQLNDDHIVLIPSIKTFEDEIVYSCVKLKTIHELFKTKSVSEFKKKFINHSDLISKLDEVGFNLELMWSREAKPPFNKYTNSSKKIK